jgi:hypothetical protein
VGVPLMVTRGYPSLSFLYEAAEQIGLTDKQTFIYYLGDHDPSGLNISKVVANCWRLRAKKFNGFSMKFQKGHKLAKGGARPSAGRKSNQVKANEAEATRIAKERMARTIGKILDLAEKLCTGVKRKKFRPKTGEKYYEIEYDSAMFGFGLSGLCPLPGWVSMQRWAPREVLSCD